MSLRLRLTLVAAALTLLGLALGLALTYWTLLGLRLAALDREGQLLADVVLDTALLDGDGVRVPRVVNSYLTGENGVNAAQLFQDGSLIWEGGVLDAPRPLDPQGLLDLGGRRSVDDWRVVTVMDEETGLLLQLGQPLVSTVATLRPYAEVAAPLALALTLLSAALAWAMVGAALRPLAKLADAADDFEAGTPPATAALGGAGGRRGAPSAGRGARRRPPRDREQRFLAYAAHELRTPISALRASLESARSGGRPLPPEAVGRLHREALRLEAFAQNLLALSRAERGELRPAPLDLAELAETAYDRFQPLALERRVQLELRVEGAPLRGDERLLEQALNNLVANALRFAQGGPRGSGLVRLSSGRHPDGAFLEVADDGPGLGPEPREGLGLRVARAVARVHGGALELHSDNGLRARLWFPDAAAPDPEPPA